MKREEVEQTLRDLINEVVVGHENLLAGEDFGMQGIHKRIDDTCKAALALPNEDVVMLQPAMKELRDCLAEFSAHLDLIMKKLNEVENEAPVDPTDEVEGTEDDTPDQEDKEGGPA